MDFMGVSMLEGTRKCYFLYVFTRKALSQCNSMVAQFTEPARRFYGLYFTALGVYLLVRPNH
jgi:hypothetical protein